MKKTIKIILFSILTIALIFGFFILITVYPELIMKNKIEYKNYRVYSTASINNKMVNILELIDNIVAKCPIYQPNINHRIFFYNENRFFKFIQEKLVRAPTFAPMYSLGNSKIQNIITFRPVDIENNRLIQDENQKPYLTQIIAHEIIHTFQNRINGDPEKIPFWKIEGYAEYWSDLNRDKTTFKTIALKADLLRHQNLSWMKDKNGDFTPFGFEQIHESYFQDTAGNWYAGIYFVAHLMVQYVFEIRSIDYDTFMSTDTKQNDILNEMFTWSENYSKL